MQCDGHVGIQAPREQSTSRQGTPAVCGQYCEAFESEQCSLAAMRRNYRCTPLPCIFRVCDRCCFLVRRVSPQELGWSIRNGGPGGSGLPVLRTIPPGSRNGAGLCSQSASKGRDERREAKSSCSHTWYSTHEHTNIQGGRVRPSQAAAVAAGRPSTEPTSGTDSAVSDTMLQVAAKAALPSEYTE